MRKIIAAERPLSAARQRRIDRALEPLAAVRQGEIFRQYDIDQETLLPLKAPPYSFAEILALCATREEREGEIKKRVMQDAHNEAWGPHLTEYRRWGDRLHSRIAAKVLSAMRGSDFCCTGSYNGRDRRRLVPVELRKANLNLRRDILSIGQTDWHMIQIEEAYLTAAPVPPGGTPQVATERSYRLEIPRERSQHVAETRGTQRQAKA